MIKRTLGATRIDVSEIAFGGVEIGLPYGVHKCLMDEHEAIDLLHVAVDGGMNFFDTARMYGCSEERMGKAFKNIRDKVVISTKCPHIRDANKKIRTGRVLRDFLDRSLNESLHALQTDYIDVYLAHSVDTEILKHDDVAQAFEHYKRKGLVRSIGVSTYGCGDAELAVRDGRWNVVQLAFNLMDQTNADLFTIARRQGVGIMVRSVLMRGILTDTGIDLSHEKLRPVAEHREKYFELLNDHIKSLSDLATKFVLSFADISSVLVGIDKMAFLHKALAMADGNYLPPAMLVRAKELAYHDPAFLDLAVWDRNGWTK